MTDKDDWRTMGSAPTDGTVILIYVPTAKRRIKMGQWIEKGSNWAVYGWKCMNGNFHKPTRWMPLPAPPQAE